MIRTGSSRRFYECSENRPCAKPPLVDSLWRRRIRAAKRTRDPRSGGTFPRAVPRDEMMLPWPLRRSKIDSAWGGKALPRFHESDRIGRRHIDNGPHDHALWRFVLIGVFLYKLDGYTRRRRQPGSRSRIVPTARRSVGRTFSTAGEHGNGTKIRARSKSQTKRRAP
jgi:hypothetical protein